MVPWCTRSEEHTSELQSHSDLHSFPTRRSSDLEPLGHVELADAHLLDPAVAPDPRDLLALAYGAVVHAAEGEPADVWVCVEIRDARLERVRLVVLRRGDALD